MQLTQSSHSGLRQANQQRILSEILLSGSITRTELTHRTGLTNASVSRITKALIDAGFIIESDQPVTLKGPGRRFVNITVNPQGGYVIGIKINALRQSILILDLAKNTIAKKELNLESLADSDQVLKKIAKLTLAMIQKLDLDKNRILGVGVAITGAVDSQNGLLIDAPALGWKQIAIADSLHASLELPIHVENLPNAINLCEHRFGITSSYNNIIAINAALGLGSSLILDNHLIRGSTNSAGLLGQLSFTDSGQHKNKTVDDLTAGWRILSELEHEGYSKISQRAAAKKLMELINDQNTVDSATKAALQQAGHSLGRILEFYIAMTNPDAILLSGPLANHAEYIKGINNRIHSGQVKILTSRITGSIAAGWLAINEFLIQRHVDLSRYTPKEAA